MAPRAIALAELNERIARRLAEYHVPHGKGEIGTLTLELRDGVTRVFRAHWTGFKLVFAGPTVALRAELSGGKFWTEGYIAAGQPSWILAFRARPPAVRGSGGPRPDDKLASEQSVGIALEQRQHLIETGVIRVEELIRMEDFDNPLEAIDEFFNYTSFYVLKAVGAEWEQLGYEPDPSIGWSKDEEEIASVPVEAAIEEGLKKSDIIWLVPDTSPDERPIPCWFAAREGRIYVLSGERQQVIPDASRLRDTGVILRWKGRDARLVEFSARVRRITAAETQEFAEIAELLLAKRQSVTGTAEENIARWMRECVILELTPRV